MIEGVAQVLKDNVNLGVWSDRVEGLATPAKITSNGQSDVVFPFAHGVTECSHSTKITPDDKFRSVLWMESGGQIEAGEMNGMYRARIDVLCWLNLKKLGAYVDDKPDRTASAVIANELIESFRKVKVRTGNVHIQKVRLDRVLDKNLSLFSKYTFKEDLNWWFGAYDYFGVRLIVDFAPGCDVFELGTEVC